MKPLNWIDWIAFASITVIGLAAAMNYLGLVLAISSMIAISAFAYLRRLNF